MALGGVLLKQRGVSTPPGMSLDGSVLTEAQLVLDSSSGKSMCFATAYEFVPAGPAGVVLLTRPTGSVSPRAAGNIVPGSLFFSTIAVDGSR